VSSPACGGETLLALSREELMLRRLVRVSIVLSFGVLTAAAYAAEGRIPVWAPGTVIGADGKYVVTRNIVGAGGAVITIGAPNVDLDLNGFTLSGVAGSAVISVLPGTDHVTIRNGTLAGGAIGVDAPGATRKVDIEGLKIHDVGGAGIHLGDVEGLARRPRLAHAPASRTITWAAGRAA
jgi:hypothetical protein